MRTALQSAPQDVYLLLEAGIASAVPACLQMLGGAAASAPVAALFTGTAMALPLCMALSGWLGFGLDRPPWPTETNTVAPSEQAKARQARRACL